ncbi:MAG: ISAs1 family transposase [Cyanobacteria bacterium P01_E01_bin.35]
MASQLNSESLKGSIEKCFGEIPDSRIQKKTAHKLIDIIAISILAIICGADSWSAIETYGRAKQNWLSTFLELENGIPSHDTFARVISRLDPEILEQSFQRWIGQMTGKLGLEVVAIDGKTLKGSYDRENALKSLQMVSAWSSSHRLVLGQVAVDKKSNEIRAIPILLEQLDVSGAIITIDAMGTQTAIAKNIQAAEADYILTLKSNHPTLAKEGQDWFQKHRAQPDIENVKVTTITCEAGHHRIEKRQFWQVPVELVFSQERIEQWQGLKTLVIEESKRILWNQETNCTRLFLSSLNSQCDCFPTAIRGHWGIENQLHWCLDVVFNEDSSRIRQDNGARNLSILRRLALNLLRQDPSKGSLKMKRYKAGLDDGFLLQILAHSSLF